MTSGSLPPVPDKRYFSISEVGELCRLKPHVLRYWEQEFSQLRPLKRRGNRRYYRPRDIHLIRRIRDLLYDQGFTIQGARLQLNEKDQTPWPEPVARRADTLSAVCRELELILHKLEQ